MNTSKLEIRVTPEEKSAWVRAAQTSPDGPGLADWVIRKLNAAASAEERAGQGHDTIAVMSSPTNSLLHEPRKF